MRFVGFWCNQINQFYDACFYPINIMEYMNLRS